MKRPDKYIIQYADGTFKTFSFDGVYNWHDHAFFKRKHGKIICKFKVYRK